MNVLKGVLLAWWVSTWPATTLGECVLVALVAALVIEGTGDVRKQRL